MSKKFTKEEVAKHNKPEDCWIIVHGKVYDVTKFANEHPGGKKILINVGGKDASSQFDQFHGANVMQNYGPKLIVGEVGGASTSAAPKPAEQKPAAAAPKPVASSSSATTTTKGGFGDLVPYADPYWYQPFQAVDSPYYKESHKRLREAMRKFVDTEVTPFCHEWDEKKFFPGELRKKAYEAGWFPAVVGKWPTHYIGDKIAGGVTPEEFDYFHELIIYDELCRCGSGGILWSFIEGIGIGLPPIMHYGTKYLQDKTVKQCLTGEKVICLGITEPYGGSDVAGLKTEAKKSPCGKYYIVNGEKKWITNGTYADFFTVAVRTGGEGNKGISLLLLERGMAGITTKQMNCMGVWPSGTSYITFEDVKVPVENLIGKEGEGFKYIMNNFNHERWGLIIQSIRFARVCYEDAFKYAHKRKTFGQRLIDNAVIRAKLGDMARQIESAWAYTEQITYQMTKMTPEESNVKLGGAIALCKVQATLLFEYCAREAIQIFGGLGYTRGGQAEKVERLYREVRAFAIGGGSEEILKDLGVRQAMKNYNSKL